LLFGVLSWEDVITERGAWDVFIWYGGLVRMAEALGDTGITKRFAETAASFSGRLALVGGSCGTVVDLLLRSLRIREHNGARDGNVHPFLVVILAAGAPPYLAALLLAYFSNLDASLTHFGTTPAPITSAPATSSSEPGGSWDSFLVCNNSNLGSFRLFWWKVLNLW